MKNNSVILGVTGSIAAYKACDISRALQEAGFLVDIIMTAEAQHFITPLSLQSLANGRVHWGMFDAHVEKDVEHIALADKAGAVLIAPATANIIGKLACGIYDDLLTCVVAATRAPVLLAPAMNEAMYRNPIVEKNCKTLQHLGMKIIGPRVGKLACGATGQGCLESVETIVQAVKQAVKLIDKK